jgi:exosome complex component RRP42
MKRTVVAEIKREQIKKLASSGKRIDGRKFEQFRELSFEVNPIGPAEGSARVKLGKTDVIVGVKMNPGTPFPDKPGEGVLMTGNELKPMAHPDFEPGPPNPDSVEIARVVDRGIRESRMLDMEKLCIVPGEKVWILNLDIQAIDFDGNMIDAATIAGTIALHNAKVPATRYGLGEDFKMPVKGWPLTATFVKIGSHVMVDPNITEEQLAEARLTVSIGENGNIHAMQKGLSGALTYEEVSRSLDLAASLTKELRLKVKGR